MHEFMALRDRAPRLFARIAFLSATLAVIGLALLFLR